MNLESRNVTMNSSFGMTMLSEISVGKNVAPPLDNLLNSCVIPTMSIAKNSLNYALGTDTVRVFTLCSEISFAARALMRLM